MEVGEGEINSGVGTEERKFVIQGVYRKARKTIRKRVIRGCTAVNMERAGGRRGPRCGAKVRHGKFSWGWGEDKSSGSRGKRSGGIRMGL